MPIPHVLDELLRQMRPRGGQDVRYPQGLIDWLGRQLGAEIALVDRAGEVEVATARLATDVLSGLQPVLTQLSNGQLAAVASQRDGFHVWCEALGRHMLIRLTWPSTTPEFQGSVRPAMTASRSMPAAKAWRLGWSSWQTASSHCGSCSPLTFGEHVGEGPDVTGQGAEFRAVGRDGLEPELFDLGQRRGSAGDPSGHHAGYWRIAKDWLDHRLARGTRRRTATAADGKAGDWLAPPPPHDLGRGRLRQPEGGTAALNQARPPDTSAASDRSSPTASTPGSPPGATQSTPASCPASPASHSTCSETSTP